MLSKIYLCPTDKKYGCTWEGSSEDIFDHFSQEHEELLFFTGSINISLHVTSENRLLLLDTEIYLLQTKIKDDDLNVYLRYLGPGKIASNLTFDIDISANGVNLPKSYIKTNQGYFSVALGHIQSCLGDVDLINFKLLISGDFTSHSSTDDFFIDAPNNEVSSLDKSDQINEEEDNKEIIENVKEDSIKGSTLDLQNLFGTPKEGNSPIETRDKKRITSGESNRSTWYGLELDTPKNRSPLNRSQTFTPDDMKNVNVMKRQASMRSLSSIAERDLDSELKCSNCTSHLAVPIFLCDSEHNICATCYQDKRICSICNQIITSERNQELEKKCLDYLYVCRNKINGCTQKLHYLQIIEHEINCTFCQYTCPMQECTFKSAYKQMVAHLSLIHSSVKTLQSFIAVFQKFKEIFLVNGTMGIFYCSWEQIDNKVVWRAKFCGPKERKFFCELKFKGKTFPKALLLTKYQDYYFIEMSLADLKEFKVKPKHSILTIIR